MKGRTTLFLLAAVIALGLYIQFGERRRDTVEEREDAARLALRFDAEAVDALRIETVSSLFVLEKTGDVWRIASPSTGLADGSAVLRLIDTLAALRRSEIITAEEQRALDLDPVDYGFSTPRARITIGHAGETIAIAIGRDAPAGGQLYIRQDGRDDIIVTGQELLAALPTSLLDLRDRRLFNSQPGRVRRVEIEARDRLLHAQRSEDERWTIERPAMARGAGTAIRQWLDRLYEFRITDFVADSVAAASLYGFDEPLVQVTLTTDPKSPPQTIKVGRPADVNNSAYYAMLVGQEAVFTIGADAVDWLRHDTSEFRDSRLLSIPAMNITFIQMNDGDRSLQLQRNTQEVWEIISPKRLAADDRKIQHLLSAWTGASALQFFDPPAEPPSPTGLSDSRRSILLARNPRPPTTTTVTNTLAPASLDQELLLSIGNTNAEGNVYASAAGYGTIMEIPAMLLSGFSVDPKDYRDPVVLAVPPNDVRRITQRTGMREVAVENTNTLYRAVAVGEVPDTDAIDEVLSRINRLTASRYVEEDPRDLSAYGLLQPARQLVIGLTSGTAINRVLLFGRSEGDETFAMVQGSDTVFTLPVETVDRLMKPVANPLAPPEALPSPEMP